MEPEQQPSTTEKDDKENLSESVEKEEAKFDKQTDPETSPTPDSTKETSKSFTEAFRQDAAEKLSETQQNNNQPDEKLSSESECKAAESENGEKLQESNHENSNLSEEDADANSGLPSFPGTVTKSVPGSNDVQIEINSNSLLDRVILYSLKNKVVDNSRLDAAKNKYMLHKGSASCNSSNSNGSDSNSSSKSVEKLIEEFKGGSSKSISENSPTDSLKSELKSDISIESSNGADISLNARNKSPKEDGSSREGSSTKSSPKPGQQAAERSQSDVHEGSDGLGENSVKLTEAVPIKPVLENSALDFRDKMFPDSQVTENLKESQPTMLDLSIPHRDEKTVPPTKRNHALYVGLPDFSKQIFTAPTISRPVTTSQPNTPLMGAPKSKHPDFSNVHRVAYDMQMRHPDFSKSFSKPEASSTPPTITPSNFTEIVRKNNYISDLQLKPPSSTSSSSSVAESRSSPTPSSSSYKIDFRSSTAAISQKLVQELKPEQPSTSQIVYPNMKKEGINAYHQQLIIDEPMAHIIHKNQFLPNTNDQSRVGGWSDRNERLLGGGNANEAPKHAMEVDNKSQVPYSSYISSEDPRKTHPAYYPPHARELNNNSQESQQLSHEFSLKQKEQQLRQEGTIITIKNEPVKTPTNEIIERRSADLFRDYKLKQPKESPDSARRASETSTLASYQQAYPDFPPSFTKYNHQGNLDEAMKPSQAPPLAYPHDRQAIAASSNRSFHTPSPIAYHHQPKSPLTVPTGPSLMNPPQNWPPPLVQQPMPRHMQNSSGAHPSLLSPSPNSYQHPSPSDSSHINYGYSYPILAPPGPTAVKVSQSYQPYKNAEPYRNLDVKEIPNRHYQPPTSSSAGQNYYHQNYPDFSRHFDPGKQQLPNDHNAKYRMDYRQPADMNYQRFPPHHELEIRSVREQPQYRPEAGPSYYPREAPRVAEYPPRLPESVRHPESTRRTHDESLERSRAVQPLKVERRMEEPPRIQAGPSNLPLRRPEPTDISAIPNVKVEPSSVPLRAAPAAPSIIKSSKSIFAEVKRESPLDLSVKTVKTKADSTGCDQDISRQRPEPSGLKVEFTPNFAKVAKTDCRQQARTGPQDYPIARATSSVSETRPTENNRTPPSVTPPQIPHVSSNRNYFHERFQPTKDIERPHAPVPALSQSSHLSERPSYDAMPQASMEMHRQQPQHANSPYPLKDIPRPNEQQHIVDSKRQNQYYQPPQQAPAPVLFQTTSNKNIHHSSSTIDAARPSNHASNPRDPLSYERDRKYVEEILYRRNRKETLHQHADMRQFKPIVSPPRKRPIEHQNMNNSVPQKMGKVEEPSRSIPDPRANLAMLQHPMTSSNRYQYYEQQRFEKVENHVKSLSAIGQPPALFKNNDIYQKTTGSHSYDMKYLPDNRSEATPKQAATGPPVAQHPSSQYYPNPKAEMIQRSDPTSNYKMEKSHFTNQNFQQRPDDITLQLYPRIHHPIQQESVIKTEHQLAGPLPGTSGESARSINGLIPSSISGSNGNIARGADQSTILKLKTNLELKEQKKLIINKSEPSDEFDQARKKDLSPRQFRTKGELKGFIPLPTSIDVKSVSKTASPVPAASATAFDLLDWGSACNDFVQQLETGKKRSAKKRPANASVADKKSEEKQTCEIPGTTTHALSEVPKEIVKSIDENEEHSSSDEDKPLLELVNIQNNGVDLKKSHTSVVEKISEKISRNMREKQRLQLEQKHAARLGEPSSSENETETRRPARTAIRVRRLRKRAALGIKKTDEEPSVEEEESEEELTQKRRHKKSTSKLDDLTSSEDERKKKKLDDKKGEQKPTKSAKRAATPKPDQKKLENSSESSESDEASAKVTKPPTVKSTKKPKELGNGPNNKNLLEGVETMTRSKRKLEIEKKQLNSKILRNEKVVQNVAPDKKAKIETTPTSSKKTTRKRKDSTKTDDSKRKNESDSEVNKGKKRTRSISKLESSSSSEESQVEEQSKADR